MRRRTLWQWLGGGLAGVAVVWSVAVAQQPSAPVPCQAQLAQALQRSITFQSLATQEREGLATYLQAEIERVTKERDALKLELETVKANGTKKD